MNARAFRRERLVKYSIDLRSITLVATAFFLSFLPFWLKLPWQALAVLWCASLYVRAFCPYAQHNHGHLPVFRVTALNFLYDFVFAQVTGYPTALWELHHNRGHHRNYLNPKADVARVMSLATGRPMSRWWYAVRGNLTILPDSFVIAREEARKTGRPIMLHKLLIELAVQLAVAATLIWLNPLFTLLFFVIPNMFAGFLVWWESYVHHLNVPGGTVYEGSVTVTGERFNRFNFNIGHHTAHHEKPTLHWSLLPERTAAIAPRIPATCVRVDAGPGQDRDRGGAELVQA
jgi:beta-carotene hydroxylase